METIGERLKRLRGDRDADEIAKEISELGVKVSRASVYNYENNESLPRADYLLAMSRLFNVNPGWLLAGEGPMEPPANGLVITNTARLEAIEHMIHGVIASGFGELREGAFSPISPTEGAGVTTQQARDLVRRYSPDRPPERPDEPVGEDEHQADRA